MSKEILNIEEACQFLGLKTRTMYNLLKEEKIPATKIGGQWRFSKKMLLELFLHDSNQNEKNVADIKNE